MVWSICIYCTLLLVIYTFGLRGAELALTMEGESPNTDCISWFAGYNGFKELAAAQRWCEQQHCPRLPLFLHPSGANEENAERHNGSVLGSNVSGRYSKNYSTVYYKAYTVDSQCSKHLSFMSCCPSSRQICIDCLYGMFGVWVEEFRRIQVGFLALLYTSPPINTFLLFVPIL